MLIYILEKKLKEEIKMVLFKNFAEHFAFYIPW